MQTFKVCLSKEQWERVCKNDEEIAAEVARQQPDLASDIGFELVTTVQRRVERKGSGGDQKKDPPKDSK